MNMYINFIEKMKKNLLIFITWAYIDLFISMLLRWFWILICMFHHIYFTLPHPCVHTLMVVFPLKRNTNLYTSLALPRTFILSKSLPNLPLTFGDIGFSPASALASVPPTSSQWSWPYPLESLMLLNVAPKLEPRNNLYLK